MRNHERNVLIALLFATASMTSLGQSGAPLLAEPGISPDGREIAFASGGDIWAAPLGGSPAVARLLVSHPATESRPLYRPAVNALAFVSTRTGNGDIYVLRFGDASLTRLTFDDGAESLDGWSRDGKWIFFSSTTRDIAGMNDVFRISVEGGAPMPVTNERYTNEYFSAQSPDGRTIAFSARGIASQQWWRHGHSHIDQSEIWLAGDGEPSSRYTRLVDAWREELVADVERRRQVGVLHVRPKRQREPLADRRRRRRAPADEIFERATALAQHHRRRQDHRL